jgi:hypothetical protein
MTPSRLAVVDDTSSRIQYTGDWTFELHDAGENGVLYGPSMNHTTHDLTSGDGSFSFAFTGTNSLLWFQLIMSHLSEILRYLCPTIGNYRYH